MLLKYQESFVEMCLLIVVYFDLSYSTLVLWCNCSGLTVVVKGTNATYLYINLLI